MILHLRPDELRHVGAKSRLAVVTMPRGRTSGIVLFWHGGNALMRTALGGAALAVARRIAHHFPTAGGMTDVHGVVQIAPRLTVSLLTDLRPT